jgi:CRISPR-associated protein Csb3
MTLIRLAIDARNPAEYLAACGLVELVGRIDPHVQSGWTRCTGMVPEVPTAATDVCEIDADLEEPKVAGEFAVALGARNAWSAVTQSGRVPLADAVGAWCAGLEVIIPSQGAAIVIDHWYECAFVDGSRIVQRHGKRDGKSRWKFWAGQQDSKKGITGLVLDLVDGAAGVGGARRFQDPLTYTSPGSSRLNLDAATTRSSIDRGISANDAAANRGSAGRPILELLAAIGLSAFFPPRRYGNSAPDGTVGVERRLFRYSTWSPRAPLSIARLSARGVKVPSIERNPREAAIGMMGQYSYLKFARSAGVTEIASPSDALSEEEDADEQRNDHSDAV